MFDKPFAIEFFVYLGFQLSTTYAPPQNPSILETHFMPGKNNLLEKNIYLILVDSGA